MDLHQIYASILDEKDPENVHSLGWSNYEAQQSRFRIIHEIGIVDGDSVLDVGCGYGDFSQFVCGDYLGIDLRSQAINIAKKKYKLRNFETKDVFSVCENYDWIVASGIFCFELDNWEEDTLNTLRKMYSICNKGVAVNFLSHIATTKYEGMKYVKPDTLVTLIADLASGFTLRHDYDQEDMTIYLFKK